MSYNAPIIEKMFRGNTIAVFANPPLNLQNGPLCDTNSHQLLVAPAVSLDGIFISKKSGRDRKRCLKHETVQNGFP